MVVFCDKVSHANRPRANAAKVEGLIIATGNNLRLCKYWSNSLPTADQESEVEGYGGEDAQQRKEAEGDESNVNSTIIVRNNTGAIPTSGMALHFCE